MRRFQQGVCGALAAALALMGAGCAAAEQTAAGSTPGSSGSAPSPAASGPVKETPTESVNETMNSESTGYRFFAKPEEGWVGDVMPFYDNGRYNLFYLQDWRDGAPQFHPFHLMTTENLTDYAWEKEMIPCGGLTEPDIALGTGSVLKGRDGRYHAFYTGHNYNYPNEGKPKEAMMHAVSDDMQSWTKIPEDTITAPDGYEVNDFRDPYVFWCEDAQEYWMLVSARKDGYGVIALFSSQDLSEWTVREPLYAPEKYFMLECADLFQFGDYWYLFFSEFDYEHSTHYRVAKSPYGPFEEPDIDMLDGRTFYAGKTGGTASERTLFGWIPTKSPAKDSGQWEWAGNMAALSLSQNQDGSLNASLPASIRELFRPAAVPVEEALSLTGNADWKDGILSLRPADGLAGATFGKVGDKMLIEADVTLAEGTTRAGFLTNYRENFEAGFGITLNQAEGTLNFASATLQFSKLLTDRSVVVPVRIPAGESCHLEILIEQDIAVLYCR